MVGASRRIWESTDLCLTAELKELPCENLIYLTSPLMPLFGPIYETHHLVEVELFYQVTTNRTRDNGFNLLHGKFSLDIRKVSSQEDPWSSGTGCPGNLWSHHPWRWSRHIKIGTDRRGLLGVVEMGWQLK